MDVEKFTDTCHCHCILNIKYSSCMVITHGRTRLIRSKFVPFKDTSSYVGVFRSPVTGGTCALGRAGREERAAEDEWRFVEKSGNRDALTFEIKAS